MAITTADIHAAADALEAKGKHPTLLSLRNTLGGGSFSTISKALKSWRASKKQQHQPQASTIPQALTDGAAHMATALWEQATEQAQQSLQEARTDLEQQRAAMESQRLEAVEAADVLACDLEVTRKDLKTAQHELETLRSELATTRERLANAIERAQQADTQAAQAREAETVARVAAAELRGRMEGIEQGLGKGKVAATTPIQESLDG